MITTVGAVAVMPSVFRTKQMMRLIPIILLLVTALATGTFLEWPRENPAQLPKCNDAFFARMTQELHEWLEEHVLWRKVFWMGACEDSRATQRAIHRMAGATWTSLSCIHTYGEHLAPGQLRLLEAALLKPRVEAYDGWEDTYYPKARFYEVLCGAWKRRERDRRLPYIPDDKECLGDTLVANVTFI